MEVINIKSTDDTPKVILDAEKNIFEISGRSLPEDVKNFYGPISDWVKEYALNPNPSTVFIIKMVYFNTASSKNIISILLTLKEMHESGKKIMVEWQYHDDDEEMLETGEEFERIVKIPFKFKKYF